MNFFVGIMSGTSIDGADAVVAKFPPPSSPPQFIAHAKAEFSESLRTELLALSISGEDELHRASLAANDFTRRCADAAKRAIKKAGLCAADIAAAGCHGQTVRHNPAEGYSIQLLNGALLAEIIGIDVVCDFRARDIAARGEGAPLAPMFHKLLWGREDKNRAIINIGGIANITLLSANSEKICGWDCGPGNMLMDAWHRENCGGNFDHNGEWAKGGGVVQSFLDSLLRHPFILRKPPKSCGREEFDINGIRRFIPESISPRDAQATFLEFTARAIADSVSQSQAKEAILCGGGAHNSALIFRIKELIPQAEATSSGDWGYPPTWIEAAAFAYFAKLRLEKQSANSPAVTGADGDRILGAVYPK